MGRYGIGERRRRGGEVEGVDPKSVDLGDECYRLTLMASFSKLSPLFSYPTICVFFFSFPGNILSLVHQT